MTCRCCFVGLVIWDPTYGILSLKDAPWDTLLTPEQMNATFMGLKVLAGGRPFQLIMYNHYLQLGVAHQCMVDHGFHTIHPMVVYKPNQNTTGVRTYIHACEFALRGTSNTTVANAVFNAPANPMQRHNLVMVDNPAKLKNTVGGKNVNNTEKPPQFAELMTERHTLPGQTVLILGGGAGGDARGVLRSKRSAVIMEKDPEQVLAMLALFRAFKAEGCIGKSNHMLNPQNEKAYGPGYIIRNDDPAEDLFLSGFPTSVLQNAKEWKASQAKVSEVKAVEAKAAPKAKSAKKASSSAPAKAAAVDANCPSCGELLSDKPVQPCDLCSMILHDECRIPFRENSLCSAVCPSLPPDTTEI